MNLEVAQNPACNSMSSDNSKECDTDSSPEGSYVFADDILNVEYSKKGLHWQVENDNPEFSQIQNSYLPAQHRIEFDQVVKSLLRRICKTACYRVLVLVFVVVIFFIIFYSFKTKDQGLKFDAVHTSNSETAVKQHAAMSKHLQPYNAANLRNKKTYTILVWNMPSTVHRPNTVEEKCGSCIVTTDQKTAKESHAIVIHYRDTKKLPDVQTRNPSQIYVWLCRESPRATKSNHKRSFNEFDNFFNATMTYRRDSDIYYPYVESWTRIKSLEAKTLLTPFFQDNIDEVIAQKRHLAAWVVSNCFKTRGAKERFSYVSRLQRAGLKADLFGRCYQNNPFPPYRSYAAIQKLSQYKFYLAFENSHHCRDYITEKFWYNSLYSGAVPIVWGPSREDLKHLAPPRSYINTEDFQSDEDLVNYIKYLDKNDDAYKEYFNWRKLLSKDYELEQAKKNNFTTSPIFSKNATFGFCALCRALQSDKAKTFRSIPSLNAWWYGSENPECLT